MRYEKSFGRCSGRQWFTLIILTFQHAERGIIYHVVCWLKEHFIGVIYSKNAVFLCKAAELVKFLAKGGGIKKLRIHIFLILQ
jgi:hypothetical protein